MRFGIMFFSCSPPRGADGFYDGVITASRRADDLGFSSVWVPERHFHPFGGIFPNPAVLGAAIAMVTGRIGIRAGSVISPLHDPIRIAEEWSVVDHLSRGRIALSFGSGWNINDFVFFPDRYQDRHAIMLRQIEAVRALWSGAPVAGRGDRQTHPRPWQADLPVWITSSGNPRTFRDAGVIGANVLTHFERNSLLTLKDNIDLYRSAMGEAHPGRRGVVTLMVHAFVHDDADHVRRTAGPALREYLRASVSLERMAGKAGGDVSAGRRLASADIHPGDLEQLLDVACQKYLGDLGLIGRPSECAARVRDWLSCGVDELACLVDFIDDADALVRGLDGIARVRDLVMVDMDAAARAGADFSS